MTLQQGQVSGSSPCQQKPHAMLLPEKLLDIEELGTLANNQLNMSQQCAHVLKKAMSILARIRKCGQHKQGSIITLVLVTGEATLEYYV